MKRQSAISAFFRPVSKRVGAVEVTGESSADSNGEQQAHDVDNQSVVAEADRNTNSEIDETSNCPSDLPAPFDSSVLPNQMPTNEGRVLQREWFKDFLWLRYNEDGTCHCSCCLWAVKNKRLSAKDTEGIRKTKWVKITEAWQDYRKGKSALRSHNGSSWHQAANEAFQVSYGIVYFTNTLAFVGYQIITNFMISNY